MKGKRLRVKYVVTKVVGVGTKLSPTMKSTDPDDIDSPFVLLPRKDPAAFNALLTYMRFCEPQLAKEIHAWLTKIAQSSPTFGTQGVRNIEAMRMRSLGLGDSV